MTLKITRGDDWIVSEAGLREPQLFKLKNKDLLLSFHAQDDVHFAKRTLLRSCDNGLSWREDEPRAHREQAIGGSADSSIVYAPDIYTFEETQGVYTGSYFISKDGGLTFDGPIEMKVMINSVSTSDYPMTPEHFPKEGHPMSDVFIPLPDYYKPFIHADVCRRGFVFWRYILEVDGRWIASMQGQFYEDNSFYRTILVESRDNGKTWNYISTIAVEYDWGKDGMCEPVLAKVADGSLLCVIRRGGNHPLAQSRSIDDGKTWTPFELLPGHGVDPDLYLMSNGVLACTYGRSGTHIMFSEDGSGHTWGDLTQIGDWRSSSYMAITEIEPGKLLVIYDKVLGDDPEGARDPACCHIGATTITVKK